VGGDLAQAEADVSYARALLQNTVIKAPFGGTVVKKMAEVGESVAPIPPGVNISTSSGAVVALADLDTLEAEVDVSESNVAKLHDQQPAEVVVEAFPDRTYRAVLRQVIPTADRTKATVMVKVTLLDRDDLLKPEMSAKVTFLERAEPRRGRVPAHRDGAPGIGGHARRPRPGVRGPAGRDGAGAPDRARQHGAGPRGRAARALGQRDARHAPARHAEGRRRRARAERWRTLRPTRRRQVESWPTRAP